MDYDGRVLSTAAKYDSEKSVWEPLPSMNRARMLCSAAFMDGKLYVIGGRGAGINREVLTCGEEYDFEQGSWRVIDNMSKGLMAPGAPPRVAVVNNELYAADYSKRNVKRYDKQNNRWITLGKLPGNVSQFMFREDMALKACGDKLITIRRSVYDGRRTVIELYSWVPNEQPLVWNLIASHPSGASLYNSAVMSC
jgi:N-acetylneuraminic acid mutarotase